MQTIQGTINGNQVQLSITHQEQKSFRKKKYSNFAGPNFIAGRGEDYETISYFFKNKMLKCIKVLFHQSEPIIKLIYGGATYLYNFAIGAWCNLEYKKTYFASSIRELVWKYILADDADMIKQSESVRRSMIDALNAL